MTPNSRAKSDARYSRVSEIDFLAHLYGTITLYGGAFQPHFKLTRMTYRSLQHHISPGSLPGIRFALYRFRSPLVTVSRLISSPAGTKMFQSPAFPFPNGNESENSGSPIRPSLVQRLHAPTQRLSQLGTTFFGSRTEPSPKWRSLATGYRLNTRPGCIWFLPPEGKAHVLYPRTNKIGFSGKTDPVGREYSTCGNH